MRGSYIGKELALLLQLKQDINNFSKEFLFDINALWGSPFQKNGKEALAIGIATN